MGGASQPRWIAVKEPGTNNYIAVENPEYKSGGSKGGKAGHQGGGKNFKGGKGPQKGASTSVAPSGPAPASPILERIDCKNGTVWQEVPVQRTKTGGLFVAGNFGTADETPRLFRYFASKAVELDAVLLEKTAAEKPEVSQPQKLAEKTATTPRSNGGKRKRRRLQQDLKEEKLKMEEKAKEANAGNPIKEVVVDVVNTFPKNAEFKDATLKLPDDSSESEEQAPEALPTVPALPTAPMPSEAAA